MPRSQSARTKSTAALSRCLGIHHVKTRVVSILGQLNIMLCHCYLPHTQPTHPLLLSLNSSLGEHRILLIDTKQYGKHPLTRYSQFKCRVYSLSCICGLREIINIVSPPIAMLERSLPLMQDKVGLTREKWAPVYLQSAQLF